MSRIIINGYNEIYIDDYKSVIKISGEEIVISCRKYVLIITGHNLYVDEYSICCMTVKGNIKNISWSV